MDTQPTTLLFDVGGVLIENYDVSEDVRTVAQAERAKFQATWSSLISQYGSGQLSTNEFWDKFCGELDVPDTSKLRSSLSSGFIDHYTPLTRNLQRVQQLGARGYRLAILSDTIQDHSDPLREFGIYDDFEPLFLSNEIGSRKSNHTSDAYDYALHELGESSTPERVLFIDDREDNLLIPQQMGIQTIHASSEQAVIDHLRHI